jgi:hypothetical protein
MVGGSIKVVDGNCSAQRLIPDDSSISVAVVVTSCGVVTELLIAPKEANSRQVKNQCGWHSASFLIRFKNKLTAS